MHETLHVVAHLAQLHQQIHQGTVAKRIAVPNHHSDMQSKTHLHLLQALRAITTMAQDDAYIQPLVRPLVVCLIQAIQVVLQSKQLQECFGHEWELLANLLYAQALYQLVVRRISLNSRTWKQQCLAFANDAIGDGGRSYSRCNLFHNRSIKH